MPPRTEEQLRRRAKNERRRYTSKRMSSLKQRFPLIPPDVLERATLRQVSTAVRKIGYGQNALSAFSAGECSSSLLSNILPEEYLPVALPDRALNAPSEGVALLRERMSTKVRCGPQ